MSDLAREVSPVNIEDELKSSYLDYAMSVIVGRALPDVRDGLKPVHRRVLFAMNELRNDFNKPYKKSARVVGDVIGKYHPHGDSAVYDTIVRMAQDFSLRYMLVDGQGNFGSVDGDSAAAMRYTEIRMAKIAHQLLADLDKETVNFVDNYDGTERIPDVLPTRVPNLLVNGSSGIAVGMATNIPPHNLTEVIDGSLAMIDNPDIDVEGLMEYIPGPDFPTAATISGRSGIVEAYKTGRGRIHLRAQAEVEVDEKTGKETIIVTEIPYQVNKARLIEKIAELVKEKRVEGISALRDESDKDGMRIVIEIRRGDVGEVVLNHLYANTQLQVVFGINMVALDKGQPRLFNLRDMLDCFIRHRREVVTRRSVYELRKARERAHILEGLAISLANIDEIIELIRRSPTPAEAKAGLIARAWQLGDVASMLETAGVDAARPDHLPEEYGIRGDNYHLTEEQAQAILDLRLHKLTGLEHEKILDEYKGLLEQIAELLHILNSSERLMEVIREELVEIRSNFGDERKTDITAAAHDISMEDLINEEDVVLTLSHEGYVKYQPLTEYEAQRRGGKGKAATKMKDEDFIERLWVANTHDTILCFSTRGRIYWMKVYQLPLASRASRGKPIVNLLPLEADERITAILPTRDYPEDKFVVMATRKGTIKKTPLPEYSRPRNGGIIALNLVDDDELIGVDITDGSGEIMLFSDAGKVVRFAEEQVRSMGRTATGVRGIRLEEGQRVVSLIVPREYEDEEANVLTVTENGYGKRTPLSEYPAKSRATKGVVSIKVSERNGSVVGAMEVIDGNEIMLISNKGTLVRTRVNEVSTVGRNTQGVRLIRTADDEKVVGLQRIDEIDEDEVLIDGEVVTEEGETAAEDNTENHEGSDES
ncbi:MULTISPECIES: DNA gyrase subunit A [Idiomarina]|jgi:DNA gyrase subunit A|uniref:DNA gyrase subunit A n=1 Tax=Idiomarina TaxID=135575 RepID=UPI0006C85037|nr:MULTISPECIES: DNA gyrase subunit A [Idiomarina]KPD22567.1 DNA gyrase subunit A [Idiomarina abyssalis]MAO67274.1 DNA gyrase subunit A [Idiomarina sp.]MBF80072.1 DNA gyrase subunit A [Idiomarina sp.]MBP58045.1 DNA gyrase subunit A [Idiomarina sp.]SFT43349.1 DNA gyrase subunit A [Idiomarina abyssalis]|tara:strand:- start:38220 stop:40859 length:2640 start_codon:yes stop_codon:yes gene_type:complete